MTVAERVRKHRALAAAMDAGRAVRIDRVADETRAALSGDAPDERARKLEAKAATWSRWLTMKSAGGGDLDHATKRLFAAAFARLETLAEDSAAEAVRKLMRRMETW
jgi:hypothetical protein